MKPFSWVLAVALVGAAGLRDQARGAEPARPVLVDESKLRDEYTTLQQRRLTQGKFDDLEAEAERCRTGGETWPGGMSKLVTFYDTFQFGITRVLRAEQPKGKKPSKGKNKADPSATPAPSRQVVLAQQQLDLVGQWLAAKPDSVTARIAQAYTELNARYYMEDPEWYQQSAQRVAKLIREIQNSDTRDPALIHLQILTLDEQSPEHRTETLDALLDRAVKTAPLYLPSFFTASRYFPENAPDGQMSWVHFVETMTDKTRALEGDGMYARQVWARMQQAQESNRDSLDSDFYRRHKLSWARVRQGFWDINERHPGSRRLLNYFALYACIAQDWPTAHRVFELLGDAADTAVWDTERTYRLWRDAARPSTQDAVREPWGQIAGLRAAEIVTTSFSPDGRLLAIGFGSGEIVLWDMTEQRIRSRWRAHDSMVRAVSFSPDGRVLASANGSWTQQPKCVVTLWDVNLVSSIESFPVKNPVTQSLQFMPDGSAILIASRHKTNGAVVLHNLATKKSERISVPPCGSMALASSPSGHQVAFGCIEKLNAWDSATRQLVLTNKPIALGPEQKPRSSRDRCNVCIYIHSLAYNHAESILAVGRTPFWDKREYAGMVNLFNTTSLEPLAVQPEGETGGIRALAFTPDDRYLVGGGYDCDIRLWQVDNGHEIVRLFAHFKPIDTLSISPDGRFLVTGGIDQVAKIWDLRAILRDTQPAAPAAADEKPAR